MSQKLKMQQPEDQEIQKLIDKLKGVVDEEWDDFAIKIALEEHSFDEESTLESILSGKVQPFKSTKKTKSKTPQVSDSTKGKSQYKGRSDSFSGKREGGANTKKPKGEGNKPKSRENGSSTASRRQRDSTPKVATEGSTIETESAPSAQTVEKPSPALTEGSEGNDAEAQSAEQSMHQTQQPQQHFTPSSHQQQQHYHRSQKGQQSLEGGSSSATGYRGSHKGSFSGTKGTWKPRESQPQSGAKSATESASYASVEGTSGPAPASTANPVGHAKPPASTSQVQQQQQQPHQVSSAQQSPVYHPVPDASVGSAPLSALPPQKPSATAQATVLPATTGPVVLPANLAALARGDNEEVRFRPSGLSPVAPAPAHVAQQLAPERTAEVPSQFQPQAPVQQIQQPQQQQSAHPHHQAPGSRFSGESNGSKKAYVRKNADSSQPQGPQQPISNPSKQGQAQQQQLLQQPGPYQLPHPLLPTPEIPVNSTGAEGAPTLPYYNIPVSNPFMPFPIYEDGTLRMPMFEQPPFHPFQQQRDQQGTDGKYSPQHRPFSSKGSSNFRDTNFQQDNPSGQGPQNTPNTVPTPQHPAPYPYSTIYPYAYQYPYQNSPQFGYRYFRTPSAPFYPGSQAFNPANPYSPNPEDISQTGINPADFKYIPNQFYVSDTVPGGNPNLPINPKSNLPQSTPSNNASKSFSGSEKTDQERS